MKTYNQFLTMLQTTPSPKHFIDSPKASEVSAKTPFITIKGNPVCLTRGFDKLRGKKGLVKKKVQTLAGEIMERPMKIVFVQEYDPVEREYKDLGDFWVDIDTGSLYSQFDGVCQSSTLIWMVME